MSMQNTISLCSMMKLSVVSSGMSTPEKTPQPETRAWTYQLAPRSQTLKLGLLLSTQKTGSLITRYSMETLKTFLMSNNVCRTNQVLEITGLVVIFITVQSTKKRSKKRCVNKSNDVTVSKAFSSLIRLEVALVVDLVHI